MKLRIAVAAFLPLLFGCADVDRERSEAVRQSVTVTETDTATENVSPETFALGTAVTSSGAVPQNAVGETFLRGGEVYLSIDVSGASSDQTVEVKWLDPSGTVLRRDVKGAPQGMHYVPFSSGDTRHWQPGQHRALVLIDGRSVSEKSFLVM